MGDSGAAARSPWRRRIPRILGGAVALGVAGAILAWWLTPSVSDAPRRVQRLAAADHAGPLLTRLPDRLSAAVLAVEDHRFYHHPGLDGTALLRAGSAAVAGHDSGAATIEVQLAKWLYTGRRSGRLDQAEQAVLAVKLDVAYTKSQVLLMYLNTVYFGHGYYGATAASLGYFQLEPDQLSWAQAALLAGLLVAPDALDPVEHPRAAAQRRDYALSRLVAVGTITPADRQAAAGPDLQLAGS